MKIKWIGSDDYYHSQLDEKFDKKDAIKQLILKILELSVGKEDWHLVVLDKWTFNLGRLIGNIQNADEEIGMDRGYRVAIQFLEFYNRLENSSEDQYDKNLHLINDELEGLIFDILKDENFKNELNKYYKTNPFDIEISEQGERIGIVLRVFN